MKLQDLEVAACGNILMATESYQVCNVHVGIHKHYYIQITSITDGL